MPGSGLQPPEPLADRDLVVRARGGDRAAWGELYARYADRLFDYAARLTGSRAQAADCVQDAFVLAVERIGQLRDPERVRPWLYAIVRSTAHRHYRRANRFSMQDVPDLPTDGDDVMVQGVTDRELAALLDEAAQGLSEEDREVLDLSLRHNLAAADIAAALGVSSRHASVTTERMRERLGRSVVVAVLARRPDCEEFAAMKRAEGELTPLSRKRLARHVDSCDVCAKQRDRQVRPEALLGVLPLLLIPRKAFADFEERLDAALHRQQSGGGEPADGGLDWDDDGFPIVRSARRARWLPWAAAALVGLLVGGGLVGYATRDDADGSTTLQTAATSVVTAAPIGAASTDATTTDATTTVVASSPAVAPTTAQLQPDTFDSVVRPLSPTSTVAATTGATETSEPAPASSILPVPPTTRPPTTQPVVTSPPATTATTVAPATTVPVTPVPTPTTAPTTTAATTTTTAAPDTAGPSVGTGSASPSDIGAIYNGISYCNVPPAYTTPYPSTATFTVPISDPSGVQSATFSWAAGTGTGNGTLSNGGGGNWTGTLGPVQSADVPVTSGSDASYPMSVSITARDALGNVTTVTRTGVLNVHNCTVIL